MERIVMVCGHFVISEGMGVRAFCGALRESVALELYRSIEDLMRAEAGILTAAETRVEASSPKAKRRG